MHLQLENISKKISGNTVVSDISLSFAQGEFITILGPSGCGKTTLLHIIAGVLSADSGRILLKGQDITALPPEKRKFGMVFQNYALFPNLTVEQNIVYGLSTASRTEKRAQAARLLELIGLQGMEKRFPSQLSGGQCQRVALARALAIEPEVLLLDEPLSALDAQVRFSLGRELLRLQRETGICTIMVTHDQQEAMTLADRIVLIKNGQIVQQGTALELYDAPASPFAARFIGHINTVSLRDRDAPAVIRYEDVLVSWPSESALAQPYTEVGKVEHAALLGAFYRIDILLNDFTTRITADIDRRGFSTKEQQQLFCPGALVAVTFPAEKLRTWDGA